MDAKIAIIGYGSMGRMIFEKLLASSLVEPENIYLANRTFEKISALKKECGVNVCKTNKEAASNADIIFVCLRPGDIKAVLEEIQPVSADSHIISLNGSIQFSQLEKVLGQIKISKVIPSVTAEVNESQTLVCHNECVSEKDKIVLERILHTLGNVIELPENEMGMGSELVSCMPGFIAALFNELKKAARPHTKISEEKIIEMLANTMVGTGRLIAERNMSFADVIGRVATKGGITQEGTKVIEEKFPPVAAEIFEKTLAKRKVTTEKAIESFGE